MKWRHTFSSGEEEDWRYQELGHTTDREKAHAEAREWCHEFRVQYDWSEQYRGIEFDVIDVPPKDVISELLLAEEKRAKSCKNRIKYLRTLLNKNAPQR